MAVGLYALSTLAQLKSHLGITLSTDNTILEGNTENANKEKKKGWFSQGCG